MTGLRMFLSPRKSLTCGYCQKNPSLQRYLLNNINVQNKTILSLLSGKSQWDYSKLCLHSKFHAEVSKSAKVSAQFDVEWLLERRPADRSEKSKVSNSLLAEMCLLMWLFQISDGKLAKHVTSSTAPASKKRKVVAMAGPTVAAHFRPADLTHVQQVRNVYFTWNIKQN